MKERKNDTARAILVLGTWGGWQDQRVFSTEGISITLDTNCEKRPLIICEEE